MSKIAFLDFDGVVCTDRTYKAWRIAHPGQTPSSWDDMLALFDPECVAQLNRITDAQIVVSSSWRYDHVQKHDCAALLAAVGVQMPVVGYTPKLQTYSNMGFRGKEIAQYCTDNGIDIADIVILDDSMYAGRFGIKGQGARLVCTPESTGLQHPKYINRALKLLR